MKLWRHVWAALGSLAVAAAGALAQTPADPPSVLDAIPGQLGDEGKFVPGASQGPAPTVDPIERLFPQNAPYHFRGWLDAGGIYNTANPPSKFNGPYNAVDRNRELTFNQAYLILETALPSQGGPAIGGRIDLLWGEDFLLAQSRGLELRDNGTLHWNGQFYGIAFPQAFVEAGNKELSVKLGHYYTIVGYEGVESPANFFYTHSYSYQFGGPFTHWGGLASWNLDKNWLVQAGPTMGWNTLYSNSNHVSFLGGIRYTADSKKWWSSFAVTTGQEQRFPLATPVDNDRDDPNGQADLSTSYTNRTRYSFLFDWTPSDRLEYVFHHYLGFQENGTPQGDTAWWYGVDQYLYYRLCSTLRVGTRLEWFRDEEGTRVGLNRPNNPNKPPLPGNYFAMTFGLNYTPVPNLIFRPEIRYDTVGNSGTRLPFDDGQNNYQWMLGLDCILHF
jgi:hypothetical protein